MFHFLFCSEFSVQASFTKSILSFSLFFKSKERLETQFKDQGRKVHKGKLQELHLSFCQPRTQRSLSELIARVMSEARYQSSLVRLSFLSADLLSKAPLAGLLPPNGTCCFICLVFPRRDHQVFHLGGSLIFLPSASIYVEAVTDPTRAAVTWRDFHAASLTRESFMWPKWRQTHLVVTHWKCNAGLFPSVQRFLWLFFF